MGQLLLTISSKFCIQIDLKRKTTNLKNQLPTLHAIGAQKNITTTC